MAPGDALRQPDGDPATWAWLQGAQDPSPAAVIPGGRLSGLVVRTGTLRAWGNVCRGAESMKVHGQ